MHLRLYTWRLRKFNDFPSLMSLVLDTRPETSELHSKVTSGEKQTAWVSSIPLVAVLSQTRNGVYLCFQCRCQKAGEQLARAAHLGEGAGQELCTPASPGAEGHDPFQQRQQLHVRIPWGQSQQQRGAATLRPGSQCTPRRTGAGTRGVSWGLIQAPPGEPAPPCKPGQPPATETQEIL